MNLNSLCTDSPAILSTEVNPIPLLSVSTQPSVALHLEGTANVAEDPNGMPPMKSKHTAWNLYDLSSEGINCQLYHC